MTGPGNGRYQVPMSKNLMVLILGLFLWLLPAPKAAASGDIESICSLILHQANRLPYSADQIHATLRRIEDHWRREFQARGWEFEEIRYATFSGETQSGCGLVSTSGGPVYCTSDRTIYFDPAFFILAADRMGEPSDVFLEYVLAHEVGHHIQEMRGVYRRAEKISNWFRPGEPAGQWSARLEFQADCLAGTFIRSRHREGALNNRELLDAVLRVVLMGDDAQLFLARAHGRDAQAPAYSHGSSAERLSWFLRGLTDPKTETCEPFEMSVLN